MPIISPKIVGREDQLRQIDEARQAAQGGRGSTIFLVGESGIGKSRLATEAAEHARSAGMTILQGRTSSIGPPVPFRPFTEAVMSWLDLAEPPNHPELDPYRPALAQLVRQPHDQNDSYPQRSLLMVAESVLRLLMTVSDITGCLLLLEDLHDADAETLAVVDYLIDHVDRQKVLLLLAARSELGTALTMARAAQGRRRCTILELHGLTEPQVRQMLGQCLQVAPAAVPSRVVDEMCRYGGGNPFVIEELLANMVDTQVLVQYPNGWSVVGEVPNELPHTVVDCIAQRAERLGQGGHAMLRVAALFGRRFPLSAVQAVVEDTNLTGYLRDAIAARLVIAEPDPDWYAFRHALTADALLAFMVPAERVQLAGRIADQLEAQHDGLPGQWCQVVAGLRRTSGQLTAAACLYAEAGRRALAAGAPSSAVSLLDEALALAGDQATSTSRADILVLLVQALITAGHLTRAAEHMSALDTMSPTIPAHRRIELLTNLAWAAAMSGRWVEGQQWVKTARQLLPSDAGPHLTAPIDATESCLTMWAQGPGWREQAVLLAKRAVDTALKVPLPVTACQALEVLGIITRAHHPTESNVYLEHILALADRHQLPVWRVRAVGKLGGNDFMNDGTTTRLEYALHEALRAGALREAYFAEASLAFAAVLRGDYPAATDIVDRSAPAARRLRLDDICQHMTMTLAVAAAHQGRRQEMLRRLAELAQWGEEATPLLILASGLATAFSALLEEDRAAALATLDETLDRERRSPTIYGLSGTSGLRLVLGTLTQRSSWADYDETCARGSADLRWNRQFITTARAILLGRSGHRDQAAEAMDRALQAAAPFPLARSLILRLTAEAALADGWGEPTDWVRAAEEFFQQADLPTPAMACRSLLRSAGITVSQHRDGWHHVPIELRRRGVTRREYDVFLLLADWLSNVEIGNRLFISPRTVEKHVAALLAKTGERDRRALCRLAATPSLGGR